MRLPGLRVLAILVLAFPVGPAWAHGPRGPELRVDPAETLAEVVVVPPESARRPESAVRLQRIPDRPPVERSGAGLTEVAGVLIVALGLAGLGRSWRRDRRAAIATATAALVLPTMIT